MEQSVGQTLREARTEQGIELSEVERVTKIRVKFLRAMEEDRWRDLPGPPYTGAFLSSYASFLSLDEQALVERYRKTADAAERAEAIPSTVIHPGSLRHPRSVRPAALVGAGLAAVLALGLVLAVSLGGSDSGDGKGGGRAEKSSRKQSTGASSGAAATAPSTTTATTGTEVSLELRATALVWVCVVDERDHLVVPGETLTTDETRGPFSGEGFEINLGNGSVEMTVDAQPVSVPALAEPLGYLVTPEGVRKLAPSARPTCT